jgi:beta-glucosidase
VNPTAPAPAALFDPDLVPRDPFPDGFRIGAATAAYQIEGAVTEAGRTPSIWDTFSHTPGRIMDGQTGDVACDHYHRMPADVALIADLGLDTYRFSISWPRVQPGGSGGLNRAGVDFYRRLAGELRERGIDPWVTLYHWDLPQELEDAGGWPIRDTALRFADYAGLMHEALSDVVTHWTTLNEPWCAAFLGYAAGVHAPGRTEPAAAMAAAHHLMLGHGLAIAAMRAGRPGSQLGVTLNQHPVMPASDDPADQDSARRIDGLVNRWFLDPLLLGRYPVDVIADVAAVTRMPFVRDGDLATMAAPFDLLGVNYYSRHVVSGIAPDSGAATLAGPAATGPSPWPGSADVRFTTSGRPTTAMGWEIDPSGLVDTLVRIHSEYPEVPLYITENGAAFPDGPGPDGQVRDPDRVRYLDEHLAACQHAIARGVPLRGYLVWSLMDNFEWAFGFERRFGLCYVDYPSQRRVPKDSADWYAELTATRRRPAPATR